MMKTQIKNIGIAITSTALFASPCVANAALLTDVSFDRVLFAADILTGVRYYAPSNFAGTSIPATSSSLASSIHGGSIAVNYDFSDNGSAAIFNISTAFAAVINDSLQEQGNTAILFKTTEPVNYTISASYSLSDLSGSSAAGVFAVLTNEYGSNVFYLNTSVTPDLTYTSGSLLGNSIYALTAGSGAGGAGYISGTSDITLTLTPVPVPASVWLLGSGLLGLMGTVRHKKG